MKQRYIIALFFLPFYCFSQLYVTPQKNRESFLYVQNQLLFVNKNIDLTPNHGKFASIYLRDEAQLIQGNNNIPNTGDGAISVFQEGKASAYTYNYWSAPVEGTSKNSHFGDIFYEPLSRLESQKANITGELNGRAKPLHISNKWIYKLQGNDYSDWVYVGNSFDVAPGEGFTMKGVGGTNTAVEIYGVPNNPGNQQRYDFRGRPHNGFIRLSIQRDEIRLVGNPYPSALDLDAFLLDNYAITGVAYFWDSKPVASHYLKDYEGGYGAYSPSVGSNGYVPAVFLKYDNEGIPLELTGETGYHYSRRYSPIAQGFVVEGLLTGSMMFKNEYRLYRQEDMRTSTFKAPANIPKDKEEVPSFRLNINFNQKYIRQLLLAFHPEATRREDRAMDAKNLMPLPTDAAWPIDHRPFLIDVRPLQEDEEIPLLFSIAEESIIEIETTAVINIDQKIFLLDKHEGKAYDLKEKITFELGPGEYEERFYISLFSSEAPQELMDAPQEILVFQNNPEKKTEILLPEQSPLDHISLFDISGRLVAEKNGDPQSLKYEIPTENLSKGVYIVKIKDLQGNIFSKKVIISN